MPIPATNPHPYAPSVSGANPLVSVMGRNGVAATHHYLASSVGIDVLKQGGNAVDAAVAISAVLGVVEPAMCGPAGTGNMVILWADDGQAHCLDFSGSAPSRLGEISPNGMYFGAGAAMVPGSTGGWLAALERFGTLGAETVFAPAIRYAEDGFPISATLAYYLSRMAASLRTCPATASIFLPHDRVPEPGEMLRQTDLANTYRVIAHGGAQAFYRGNLAERMLAAIQAMHGWLSAADLRDFEAEWQTPLAIQYRDWTVVTPPPPCSGVQILQTLSILAGYDLRNLDPLSGEYLHMLVEAIKLAREDRVVGGSWLADGSGAARYLEPEYSRELRTRIHPEHAAPSSGDWFQSSTNTTHFCVADRWGNLVSSTQTLGTLFGSGVVLDGTGMLLNGLLFLFDTDPKALNRLAPGKKLDLVMSPVLAQRPDGETIVVGSPGGQGSLQTIVQMLVNMIDFGLVPQQAVEAPRVLSLGRRAFIDKFGPDHDPTALAIEDRVPVQAQEELTRRGHSIEHLGEWSHTVGAGAAIRRRSTGVLEGGADPRRDGLAYAY
jgi:gamma-glutamyltranspeptidase / glutathione hydrolase